MRWDSNPRSFTHSNLSATPLTARELMFILFYSRFSFNTLTYIPLTRRKVHITPLETTHLHYIYPLHKPPIHSNKYFLDAPVIDVVEHNFLDLYNNNNKYTNPLCAIYFHHNTIIFTRPPHFTLYHSAFRLSSFIYLFFLRYPTHFISSSFTFKSLNFMLFSNQSSSGAGTIYYNKNIMLLLFTFTTTHPYTSPSSFPSTTFSTTFPIFTIGFGFGFGASDARADLEIPIFQNHGSS